MTIRKQIFALAATCAVGMAASTSAQAAVTEVEGSAGGGIVPWALLSTGKPTGSATWVNTGDYSLTSVAVQGTVMDRLELSYAHQSFDIAGQYVSDLVRALGHSEGTIGINVVGAKLKLLDMSEGLPAVAVGVQYKRTDLDENVLSTLGARDDSGTDIYLAATKVVQVGGKNLLLNGTLRATKANQIGILGFGGDDSAAAVSGNDNGYSVQFEGSAGLFAAKDTILGVEYRMKPDNLAGFKEDDWWDIFIAYLPSKNWSLVGAYADLGNIVAEAADLQAGGSFADATAEGEDERGLYLQLQVNF